MAITLEELKERLSKEDEVDLLEILNIDSEKLVEKFTDEIEERFTQLEEEFGFDEETVDEEENYY